MNCPKCKTPGEQFAVSRAPGILSGEPSVWSGCYECPACKNRWFQYGVDVAVPLNVTAAQLDQISRDTELHTSHSMTELFHRDPDLDRYFAEIYGANE